MSAPESAVQPRHAYPAPWRPCPGGPDSRALCLEQSEEEALFLRIIYAARQEQTSLDDLLRQALRLAFPKASGEDLERALGRIRARTEQWRNSFDTEGNPAWISLTLQEYAENDTGLRPDGVLPSDAESAAPPQTDTQGRSGQDSRPGLFGRIVGIFFKAPARKPRRSTLADIAAGKGTIPPPQPRPLRGLVRLAFMGGVCALAYHLLAVRGCSGIL